MDNDKKILALLLGSAWFSSSNIYGDISALIHHTNGETAYGTVQQQAVPQRQATFNSVTEILNTLPTYKNKKQSEKDKFAALYTAIVLSAPEASKTLTVKNDEKTPKLETTVATHLSKALTQVLTSPKADKIWSDSVSQTTSTNNLLYKDLVRSLKSNTGMTLKPLAAKIETTPVAAPPSAPVIAPAAPITHLVYTGQDLSQYPSLISISITVAQLRGGTDITSTKSLEITVTGDAAGALLSTQRLTVPNAKIDLSAVTNLTGLTITHADTTSVKLPNTVTSLTVSTATQVTGATVLTTLNLTGAAPVPTWATDGSLTAANATLDLSTMTGLGATLDLSTISSDITTVILPTNVTTLTIPSTVTSVSGASGLTRINLVGAAPAPTWATDGSLTTTNAILDLSAVTGLGATLDLTGLNADITTVTLPSTVTNLTIPSTVTSITGISGLTTLKLSGATPVPTWATNGSLTAANATLDLSAMTGVPSPFDLTVLNTDITTVKLPTNVTEIRTSSTVTIQLATGHPGLNRINLTGNATTVPTWATDGSLTRTNATLDLSAMTGTTVNLTGLNTDITTVTLPSTVTNLTIPSIVTNISGTSSQSYNTQTYRSCSNSRMGNQRIINCHERNAGSVGNDRITFTV